MILEHVWGPRYGTENHYLRVYFYRLRRKFGDERGDLLRTIPGVGYQLVDEDPRLRGNTTGAPRPRAMMFEEHSEAPD